ncbi:gp36+37 fusion long tail fiber distal subunit [Vibrio phage nt-1]|uniref:Long tail fiber protein Gp37 n=1 Tax=Vibrio phage nt-1 TaxID=115992 RepID=R9TIZ5_9CAUD|nr:long tail fiber protein distal subunit [Vibrio phage nt-1]AGN30345.1 gp36+37 fusion long tail fiber distal subunit [Vibrio phage nt-1]
MAELRSTTAIGGNIVWHGGNLRFDPQGETVLYNGYKLYTENDKPDPHTDLTEAVVKLAGDTMSGDLTIYKSSAQLHLSSFANTDASLYLTEDNGNHGVRYHYDGTVNQWQLIRRESGVENVVMYGSRSNNNIVVNGIGYLNTTQRIFADNYHPNADKWTTARTLTLAGEVTGSVSIDGTSNVTINAVLPNHTTFEEVGISASNSNYRATGKTDNGGDTTSDLDALTQAGTYYKIVGSTAINLPPNGTGYWYLQNYTYGTSGNLTQLAIPYGTSAGNGTISFRTRYGGVWDDWSTLYHTEFHPEADKWTTARTLTLSGDVTGSVSIDGSSNVTLSTVVGNDSHTHDGRYYTETESDARFVNVTGDAMTGFLTLPNTNANATNIIYGFGGTSNGLRGSMQYTSGDVSDITRSGFIDVGASVTGRPAGETGWLWGIHTEHNNANGYSMNLAVGQNTQRLWWQSTIATTAGDWVAVFDDEYHPNADKWTTARTISLSGDVSGSVAIDGSGNVTLPVTVNRAAGFNVNTNDGSTPFRIQRNSFAQTGQDDNVTVHLTDTELFFTHNNDDDGDSSAYTFRYMSAGAPVNLLNFSSGSITYRGNAVWHAGNDGSGSGLDADLLDGLQSTQLLRSDTGGTINGQVTIRHTNVQLNLMDSTYSDNYWQLDHQNGVMAFRYNGGTEDFRLNENGTATFLHTVTAPTFTGALSGNASSATKLLTSRTFTIGNTAKSFDGTANVSWSPEELTGAEGDANISFGTGQAVTTAEFLSLLNTKGAFSTQYWVCRGSWSYAAQVVVDTGVGKFGTAGSVIEVIGKSQTGCTIRVTTATTSSGGGNTRREFIYIDNGSTYSPGWRTGYSNHYHPNADTWTTARTLTLAGDLSGSVSINGGSNVTLTAAVANDSHTHDTQYVKTSGSSTITNGTLNADGAALGVSNSGYQNLMQIRSDTGVAGYWCRFRASGSGLSGWLFSNFDSPVARISTGGWYYGTGMIINELKLGGEVVLNESTDRTDLLMIKSSTSAWGGLQISNSANEGIWSFMTDGATCGIYDDQNGDWAVQMTENAGVRLYYNSANRIETTSAGVTVTGALTASGNVTAYSDSRLKTNVEKIVNPLDKIDELNGYTYDRTDIEERQTGVIAQEVLKVLPEAVIEDDDGMYSVAYGNMVGLLIEGIKEEKRKREALEERLARLESLIS